jgi:ATP-binding cassette subfamily B protein
MKSLKFIKKCHVNHHGMYSSGLACLTSIARYYEGAIREDELVHLSGTTPMGTTVLGLYHAANKIGFDAEGFKGEIEGLKAMNDPVILDVTMDNQLKHFVVCYGFDGQFLIGDPAWGIMQYGEDELRAVWKSKTLLQLTPNELFLTTKVKIKQKRKWMLDLIKDNAHILYVTAALDIFIAILSLVPAIFMQKLMDSLLPSQSSYSLFVCFTLFGVVLITRACFVYIKEIVLAIHRREFISRISRRIESKLMNLSMSFFESFSTEKLIFWRNDMKSIEGIISSLVRDLWLNALLVCMSVGFIFFYNFSLGMLGLASIFIYVFLGTRNLTRLVNLKQECAGFHSQNESDHVNHQQLISLIKSFGKEKMFSKIATDSSKLLQDKIYSLDILVNQKKTRLTIVTVFLMIPIIATISSLGLFENLTVGEMLAVFILTLTIYSSARKLIAHNLQIQEGKLILGRMFELESLEPEYNAKGLESKSSVDSEEFSLLVKNISFRFSGNRLIFKNISFSVKRGELITIFGETGTGKSSIFRILQRFAEIESGQIIFNQEDWKEIDVCDWRKKMAVVPQNTKLMNRTLIDNLCFENIIGEATPVMEFCKKFHFDKYFESLPQGYLTLVGEDGINLSGGYRQLVAMARALYKKPNLLLLDDATNCMDKKMASFTMNLLNSVKKNTAVILFTNRLPAASKANRIYVLDKGEMSEHTSDEHLMQFTTSLPEFF